MHCSRAISAIQERCAGRPKWEVADIFSFYGEEYRLSHSLPLPHLKVMHAIEVCRTAYLGGHLQRCDSCGFQQHTYNSCRNRHCPKCQSMTKARWIQKRKAELLPVGYFHNVFTLPHELNPVMLCNKKLMLKILFKAVSETLIQFGRNPKNGLGGKLGFLAILHTWDQRLMDHFHLHCVIAGGALSLEKGRWISSRDDFLFPVKAISIVFRGKFIGLMENAFKDGELIFPGETATFGTQNGFARLIKGLRKKKWVVYCKKPFAGPEKVLEYLGRYTHKVAISNHRIVNMQNGRVTFTYRDRRDGDTVKTMTLEAEEFIRRFLLHVLPSGFVRIRHYGFLANRSKKLNLQLCREFMGDLKQLPETPEKNHQQLMLELTGVDITLCPCCKKGSMITLYELPPLYKPQYLDSS